MVGGYLFEPMQLNLVKPLSMISLLDYRILEQDGLHRIIPSWLVV